MDKRIGAQFYNLRDFCKDAEGLRESMRKVSEMGYKVIQISGIGPIPAEQVKQFADEFGLTIALTHKGGKDFEENLEQVIADHKTMDCKIAGLGAMDGKYRSYEGIQEFVKVYGEVADKLAEQGISFAYHNHSFDFYKENGITLMDYIIENTNDNFKFVVDTYWVAHAGLDVIDFLEKVGKRAIVVHFKDMKAKLDNNVTMTEIGNGNLNWDKIIATTEKIGAEWAVVEQDETEIDPFDSLKISYDYLSKKGFC